MPSENSPQLLKSLDNNSSELVPIRNAIVSVYDKTNIEELGQFLYHKGIKIYSTGATFKRLQASGIPSHFLEEISKYTGSSEMLDGRVKTLNPKIHGGILFVRGSEHHEKEILKEEIVPFDLVIVNLYPFESAIAQNSDFSTAMENIDIGGPCMLRSAAKNNSSVTVISSSDQYISLMKTLSDYNGCTTHQFRKKMACLAFKRVNDYDFFIKEYFENEIKNNDNPKEILYKRTYCPRINLKYGCNPHQIPAAICSLDTNSSLPFEVLNGQPGYINILDAVLSFQLVKELTEATGLPSAASFKHCSPAGAAIFRPLKSIEKTIYEIPEEESLSKTAIAYILARNADPMCSFGDFVSISGEVDSSLASYLKREVSDGIIATDYSEDAIQILSQKKNGNFIILKANQNFKPPEMEYREVYGTAFVQKRNSTKFSFSSFENIVTKNTELPQTAVIDLLLASISLKYTQSNSICFAKDYQVIGVGAGQQSRIDCLKLAGRKASTWFLRQHPKVTGLKFNSGTKRQDRINMRVRYIEGDFVPNEYQDFCSKLSNEFNIPNPLTCEDKEQFMSKLTDVAVSSDAFFPFRDNIDNASKFGVRYVAHPGGSVQDNNIIFAADQYGMVMVHTGIRSFLH